MAQQLAMTETAARAAKAMDTAAAPDSSEEFQAAARVPAPADREQAIREAAYACFEARGRVPGHELDDWLQAEAQVQQANCESASASSAGQVAH